MDGFQKFLDLYLDIETPRELTHRLFLSFIKRIVSKLNLTKRLLIHASEGKLAKVSIVFTYGFLF